MGASEAVRKTSNGVFIDIKVVPGANKKGVSFDEWRKRIKVKVKGRPLKGEANDEMIEFFSKLFDRKVKIFSGETSRKKTLVVENIGLDNAVTELEDRINEPRRGKHWFKQCCHENGG